MNMPSELFGAFLRHGQLPQEPDRIVQYQAAIAEADSVTEEVHIDNHDMTRSGSTAPR